MITRQSEFQSRPWLLAVAFSLCAGAAPQASADGIYLCVDESGRRELTDSSRPGCKEISMPGAISAPPKRAAGSGGAKAPAVATPAPANFPKVDNAQQKSRDDDRRAILQEELRAEERKLQAMRRDFNGGEPERQGNEKNYAKYQERVANMQADINRSERNVESLRREIGNIK